MISYTLKNQLKKKKAFFQKQSNRKVKQVLSGPQWDGGGYKEMVLGERM
jgi:hypothetical protein